jgi:hypothetical protein
MQKQEIRDRERERIQAFWRGPSRAIPVHSNLNALRRKYANQNCISLFMYNHKVEVHYLDNETEEKLKIYT